MDYKESQTTFQTKKVGIHIHHVSYTRGYVFVKKTYIGETRPNVELEEYGNTSKDCEPAKHLKENLSYKFSWKIVFAAPENKRIRKILEASEIWLKKPSLNEQIESKKGLLFCNNVT